MNNYENVGMSILKGFFDYYCEKALDDAEYISVVKVIINGIQESMVSSNIAEGDIGALKKRLIGFNRELYKGLWLENARKHEDPAHLDLDGEAESATYYFDYIYDHGEHPR